MSFIGPVHSCVYYMQQHVVTLCPYAFSKFQAPTLTPQNHYSVDANKKKEKKVVFMRIFLHDNAVRVENACISMSTQQVAVMWKESRLGLIQNHAVRSKNAKQTYTDCLPCWFYGICAVHDNNCYVHDVSVPLKPSCTLFTQKQANQSF